MKIRKIKKQLQEQSRIKIEVDNLLKIRNQLRKLFWNTSQEIQNQHSGKSLNQLQKYLNKQLQDQFRYELFNRIWDQLNDYFS